MKMFLKVSLALLLAASVSEAGLSMHDPFYCFATDPIRPQNQMFSTITGYEAVRGTNIPIASTCTPRRFFMLTRGGTRLPSGSEMVRMTDISDRLQRDVLRNYDAGRTTLCRPDQENIADWVFNTTNFDQRMNSTLHPTGAAEMRGNAERFQRAFPSLLPSTYNQNQFLFRASENIRTQDSLRAFGEGLFGHSNIVLEDVPAFDPLMRPHFHCPLYDQVNGNLVEQEGFESTQEFEQMLEQVNRKLGFFGSNQLNIRDIRTIWDFCTFYQGWDPESPSPWCAAFSVANHAVMEYFRDLDLFYNTGYGGQQPLFSNMNCHVMQELLRFLESTDPNERLARIYSTHSTALQLFLTTLGVFRDETPLTRHNFAQQTFRQWRTSIISSMASNFVVVQYACDDGDNDLQILYNERPLWIPGCEANGLCRQSTFMRIFERFLNANCGELFCSNN